MPNETQPQIFLSYSWANKDIADEIDNDFKKVGITFQRDVRDVSYTGSIKEFMNRIGKADFVVMLISNEYLTSENCMYEVTELLNSYEFEKRILPVILGDVNFFGRTGQEVYCDYWLSKIEDAKRILTKHENEMTLADKRKVQSIYDHLGVFFQKITDLKSEKYVALKAMNYKPMLNKIGFDVTDTLDEAVRISHIESAEDQEIALEEFLKKNPDNKYGLFLRAGIEEDRKFYKKAKKYYEDLIWKYPDFLEAHSAIAYILEVEFEDFVGARFHLEQIIKLSPQLEEPYNDLANLLSEHFNEYALAKKYHEKSIALNPQYSDGYYDLACLLEEHFKDYPNALSLYEKAIEFNKRNDDYHIGFAHLLKNHFADFNRAIKHLQIAIAIDPNNEHSHFELANLLETHFSDVLNARKHYEKAIEIAPTFVLAKLFLGRLVDTYLRKNK